MNDGEGPALPPPRVWARTERRAPGADWRNFQAPRQVGPWHALTESMQSWCGKRPTRLVASRTVTSEEPPEGAVCRTCTLAMEQNRPRPFRR